MNTDQAAATRRAAAAPTGDRERERERGRVPLCRRGGRSAIRLQVLGLMLGLAGVSLAGRPSWLPTDIPLPTGDGPPLVQRDFLTAAQGAEVLAAVEQNFATRAEWVAYGELIKQHIRAGAGLDPWPRRTPLAPLSHSRREHDGYSVENVAFETVPGYWATGNLYRPLGRTGPFPVVLTTHGHSGGGIDKPDGFTNHGRFGEAVQMRAATLARMGAVVLAIDMFGYGDGQVALGSSAHRTDAAMPMQIWNATRALDFLLGLPEVDRTRVAVTGASGGGTQTFLLTALDDRVTVSVPVVMVSAYFFGGCPCESGRPIHCGEDFFTNNAMIAALAAPRPMLLVSDGGDWTHLTPEVEFPFMQHIYAQAGAPQAVANVHLPDEGHNYGPSKRTAMYAFLVAHLGLEAAAIDEARVTVEPPDALRVFDAEHPLPAQAVHTAEAVLASLRSLQ